MTAVTKVATPSKSRRGRVAGSAVCPAQPLPVAVVRLSALGRLLRRVPVAPTSIATLLGGLDEYIEFRRIVRAVFPGAAAELLEVTPSDGADLETERCWAFMHKIEAEFFPVYELESYEQVACGVPFVRFGWSYDRLHDLDKRPGELLLFALCEQPYADGFGSRIPLLEAVAALLPRELVADMPPAGLHPHELHERLDDTPYAAAAEYCDWLWCQTNTAFLDIDDEVEVVDDEWTRAYVLDLAEQWQRADALMSRVVALESWLEEDLVGHFARLLDAALDRDPHVAYERQRRLYAYEITEAGLTPIAHDACDAWEPHKAEDADQSAAPVAGGRGSESALAVPARAAA